MFFVKKSKKITKILLKERRTGKWRDYDITKIRMKPNRDEYDENLFFLQKVVFITKTFEQKDNGSALRKMMTTLNGIYNFFHPCSFTQIRMI